VAGNDSKLPLTEDEKEICLAVGQRLGKLAMTLQESV